MERTEVDEDTGKLLAEAARGDQASWDLLVERFNGLLWSIARGYRLSAEDAADVIQCTWLRLVEHLDRITDPDRLGSWLATTTRRECLQLLRRTRRERSDTVPAEGLNEPPDTAPPVDSDLLLDERNAALWQALTMISQPCQTLLRVLMASPPPSYAEVAAALDMPIGSVGPTRQRCLEHLRKVAFKDELLRDRTNVGDQP